MPVGQATGEAIYADDIPAPAGCLYAALVKSKVPHAR
jgi:xanthine dehydrogenase molybdopterin-binding subunit B